MTNEQSGCAASESPVANGVSSRISTVVIAAEDLVSRCREFLQKPSYQLLLRVCEQTRELTSTVARVTILHGRIDSAVYSIAEQLSSQVFDQSNGLADELEGQQEKRARKYRESIRDRLNELGQFRLGIDAMEKVSDAESGTHDAKDPLTPHLFLIANVGLKCSQALSCGVKEFNREVGPQPIAKRAYLRNSQIPIDLVSRAEEFANQNLQPLSNCHSFTWIREHMERLNLHAAECQEITSEFLALDGDLEESMEVIQSRAKGSSGRLSALANQALTCSIEARGKLSLPIREASRKLSFDDALWFAEICDQHARGVESTSFRPSTIASFEEAYGKRGGAKDVLRHSLEEFTDLPTFVAKSTNNVLEAVAIDMCVAGERESFTLATNDLEILWAVDQMFARELLIGTQDGIAITNLLGDLRYLAIAGQNRRWWGQFESTENGLEMKFDVDEIKRDCGIF